MDFRLTPEQEALKKDFEQFFQEVMADAPPGWMGGIEDIYRSDENWAFHRDVARRLGAKGWLSLPWPRRYGGQELGVIEQLIFNEAKGYYRVPGLDPQGVSMVAPVLLAAGTEEQREEHLPLIARGEAMWCQGWSEPNAGSDLASLTTRAVREGDEYIVNGQKIWTSGAHRSQWCHMLVRTDPAQRRARGLTYLLVDMSTPGITIRPVPNMVGHHEFNEVFFDNVRVPVRNRVGEENQGWAVTRMTMNFERAIFIGEFAQYRRALEELVEFCKETRWDNEPLSEDPLIRQRIADISIRVEVGLAMARRVGWIEHKKGLAAVEASVAKVLAGEVSQYLNSAASQIMGLYGQVKESKWAPFSGGFEERYQTRLGWTMAGGTLEIQRSLIAWEGLGLPRM